MARKKRIKNDTLLVGSKLEVDFYHSDSGREPTRDWLQGLDSESRKQLGHDIRRVQMGWPTGMPLVRKLDRSLWELRSILNGRKGRMFFTIEKGRLVILHGLIKKSQKTPGSDMTTAKLR